MPAHTGLKCAHYQAHIRNIGTPIINQNTSMQQTHEDMNVDVDIGLRNNCTAGVERICI